MRHLASAVATAHRLGARPWVARAEYEIAQLFLDPGSHEDPRRADELLDSVVRAASTMGMRGLLRDAEGLREQVPSTDNVFRREADG